MHIAFPSYHRTTPRDSHLPTGHFLFLSSTVKLELGEARLFLIVIICLLFPLLFLKNHGFSTDYSSFKATKDHNEPTSLRLRPPRRWQKIV